MGAESRVTMDRRAACASRVGTTMQLRHWATYVGSTLGVAGRAETAQSSSFESASRQWCGDLRPGKRRLSWLFELAVVTALVSTISACRGESSARAVRRAEECPPPRSQEIRVSEDSIDYFPLFATTLRELRELCPASTDTVIVSSHGYEYPAVKFLLAEVTLIAVFDPRQEDGAPGFWIVAVPQLVFAQHGDQARRTSHSMTSRGVVAARRRVSGGAAAEVMYRSAALLWHPMANRSEGPVRVVLPGGVPLSATWSQLYRAYGPAFASTEQGILEVGFCGLPRFGFVLNADPDLIGSPEVTGDLSGIPSDARINEVYIHPPPRPEFARFPIPGCPVGAQPEPS